MAACLAGTEAGTSTAPGRPVDVYVLKVYAVVAAFGLRPDKVVQASDADYVLTLEV